MNDQQLKNRIEHQIKRIKKVGHEPKPKLPSIGSLGLVMILPIVGAVYLGHWLDDKIEGYSTHWTISLLFIGIVVGFFNVYFLIKD